MNALDIKYFNEIREQRSKFAEVMKFECARGVRDSVVDKYSDQAHFIYELLQNADDTGATRVRFILKNDRLYFIHNGKRKFSVSNPKSEGEDREKGLLGDINSLIRETRVMTICQTT